MNLHENKKLFADAVLAASNYLSINPIFVEKEYPREHAFLRM